MLKEILHFAFHAPKTFLLSRQLTHAELYDTLMLRAEKLGMASWRSALVEDLHGNILEIGCGTGLMFPYYPDGVRLNALELMPEYLELAYDRSLSARASIFMSIGDGATLPYPEHHFDYVVSALVLCSVGNIEKTVSEIRRVLKTGGEFRLIEHVRSRHVLSGWLLDFFNPLWLKLNQQGCNMNRKTEWLLEAYGFKLSEVRPFKIFAPGVPAFPMRWIRAC